jgi:hypothetical protein
LGKRTTHDLTDRATWHKEKYLVAEDRVGTRVSVTNNLGDYNSVSISASWESDFEDGEDFDAAYERVFGLVEKKVEAKLDEYDVG